MKYLLFLYFLWAYQISGLLMDLVRTQNQLKDGICSVVLVVPCNNTHIGESSTSSAVVTYLVFNSHSLVLKLKLDKDFDWTCHFSRVWWKNLHKAHRMFNVSDAFNAFLSSDTLCRELVNQMCSQFDKKSSVKLGGGEYQVEVFAYCSVKNHAWIPSYFLLNMNQRNSTSNDYKLRLNIHLFLFVKCNKFHFKQFPASFSCCPIIHKVFKNIPEILKELKFSKSSGLKKLLRHFRFCKKSECILFRKCNFFNIHGSESVRRKRDVLTNLRNKTQSDPKMNKIRNTSNASSDFNATYLIEFYRQELMKKQLDREAQSAVVCLVLVSFLMLFGIWYLRGFHNRNTDRKEVTFHDDNHLLTVKEVLYRKRHFLPIFTRDDGLEEVFVHDCGNDP